MKTCGGILLVCLARARLESGLRVNRLAFVQNAQIKKWVCSHISMIC